MKFYRFIFIFFIFSLNTGYSQHSEIGLLGGTSYYLGEVNPSIQVLNELNPTIGLFYRKNTSTRYALRFGANYGKLSATDNISGTKLSDYRNLSFSSDLIEGYGILEFNFLPYQINNYRTSSFSPYVFIGAAVFRVAPEIKNNATGAVISSGSLIAPSIPFGLGVKFNLVQNLGIGIEWGMRKTFTDEIDGLSPTFASGYQLSNSHNNDWYSIVGITLNYKILTKTDHCPGVIN